MGPGGFSPETYVLASWRFFAENPDVVYVPHSSLVLPGDTAYCKFFSAGLSQKINPPLRVAFWPSIPWHILSLIASSFGGLPSSTRFCRTSPIMPSTTDAKLGTVLVTGGCGFLGYHIVRLLKEQSDCTSIHVLTRNPNRNLLDDVSYHAGDITNLKYLRTLFAEIQPHAILHVASPTGRDVNASYEFYVKLNVAGTQNLLTAATETASVKAFVFTSSTSVAAAHVWADETSPIWDESSNTMPYQKSKAIAETVVIKANNPPKLVTAAIRTSVMYGERDSQFIPGLLDGIKGGAPWVQIGDNKNLLDTLSCSNAAMAHLLCARALLTHPGDREKPKVDGESFFVTDGNPIPSWSFNRLVWEEAGIKVPISEIKVLPAWLMLAVSSIYEWMLWIFTLGVKRPGLFTRLSMEYCVWDRTYKIDKARDRFGYNPVDDRKDAIRLGVKYEVEQQRGGKLDLGKKGRKMMENKRA